MRMIVVGCGRVGSGLGYRLDAEGHDLTVIDRDPRALERLGPGFGGTARVGSALERRVLEEAGIATVDAFAMVTGSDEVNAVMARLAVQRFRVPRVVARMYDPREADLYSRLGVLTVSPVEWGISRIGHLLTLRDVAHTVALGSGRVNLMEVSVPPALSGRRAREIEVPGETRIVSLTRAGQTALADAATVLEAGDVVAIGVASGSESRLQELFGLG